MKFISLADSGNMIIVLLTIAWVVYSIYKKFKKGQADNSIDDTDNEPVEADDSVKSWMEKMLLGDEFVEKKQVAPVRTFQDEIEDYRQKKSKEPEPFLNAEMQLYKGGEYADSQQSEDARIRTHLESNDSLFESSETHSLDVDLKTAVIYSTILNRPYN
ncbi:MAG: hypothetical protein AB9842_02875 [Bacteroidales bacterium]